MWLELGMVALLLVTSVQSVLLLLLWRQARRLRAGLAEVGQHAVHASTDVPTSMLVTALGQVERRLRMLELPAAAPARPSYELAQQLAREGADVGQLIERCGLSRDEATLILQTHPATH